MSQPADLAITKTATASVVASGVAEWRLNLTNKGPGASYGYEIEDVLPLGVSNVTVAESPIPCTVGAETIGGVVRQVVRCNDSPPDCIVWTATFPLADFYCFPWSSATSPVLAASASVGPIVIRGNVPATPGSLTNTARVFGTGRDPVPADNTATAPTTVVAAAPGLSLTAAANPAGPVTLAVGASISYSFVLTNTGNVELTSPVVIDDGWTGEGSAPIITCPAGTIALLATVTCTATHAVTQGDIDRGSVALTGVALAESTGPDAESAPATATTQLLRTASLTLSSTSTPPVIEAVGQTVTLSFFVTNTGTATVSAASVALSSFSGSGTAPVITCPQTAFAPDASITCTATYTAVEADDELAALVAVSTATATAPSGVAAPTSEASTLSIPVRIPSLVFDKTADLPSATPLGDGTVLTYTLTATNSGDVTLDPVVVTDDLTGLAPGSTPNGDAEATIDGAAVGAPTETAAALSWTGALEPGQTVTITYSVTAHAGASAQEIRNAAQATGTPTGRPALTTDPVTVIHTVAGGAPALTLTATADPAGPVALAVGAPIVFSFVLANAGDVVLTTPSATSGTWTGAGAAPAVTCPAGPIAPLASVTCTATYALTQADIDQGSVALTASGAADWAAGAVTADPGTATTVLLRTASLTLAQTSPTSLIDTVGQSVSLSFLVTNTGNVTVTAPTVAFSLFSGAGSAPAVTCPADPIEPGASATCTAIYIVVADDTPSRELASSATATAVAPDGVLSPVSDVSALAIPIAIPGMSFTKTADAADGTVLADGAVLTYTLTLGNVGGAALSPAVISDDFAGFTAHAVPNGDAVALVGGVPSGTVAEIATGLTWTGALAAGETVIVTYSVTVRATAEPGDIDNSAFARASAATGPELVSATAATHHAVSARVPDPPDPIDPPDPQPLPGPPAGSGLSASGFDGSGLTPLIGGALLLIVVGAVLRRRSVRD